MQETWVRSLGQEDPLETKIETYSSILAGKSHAQRSLAGYSPWGLKELDMTGNTHTQTYIELYMSSDIHIFMYTVIYNQGSLLYGV